VPPQTIVEVPTKSVWPAEFTVEQLQSLQAAIENLEQAGLQELAAPLRQQVQARTQQLEKSLQAKRQEIARLLVEAQAIEDILRPQVQVQLQLQILEIDHARLLNAGSEECLSLHCILTRNALVPHQSGNDQTSEWSAELYELVVHAKAHDAAKIISRPRVITLMGQEANVVIGQSIPVIAVWLNPGRVEFEQVGTKISVTPKFRHASEITCAWQMEFKSPNPAADITLATFGLPMINVAAQSLSTQTHHGEFFVVGQPLPTEEHKSILVFATVELPKPQPEPPRELPNPQN